VQGTSCATRRSGMSGGSDVADIVTIRTVHLQWSLVDIRRSPL
jgi:hypothetical protein